MNSLARLVVFQLDEWRYALRLEDVARVVMAAEITPLPRAPAVIAGVINVQGNVVPVMNIRMRFGLPPRETGPGDHLILAKTPKRSVALVVDAVTGMVTRPVSAITAPGQILPSVPYVEGVVKLEDGLVFIHNLETFLSIEEETALEEAMASH
ncbi:MAG TPA: chemotaxis protein CheW [Chthoniobacteraceae bacterium]|nr:chemotaxis protein CheW [Chthoniobacteraceae bacterium]